jgi:hypothetical protein
MIYVKTPDLVTSPVCALIRDDACVREKVLRGLPSEKRIGEAEMNAQTRKHSLGDSPAVQLLVEALAALVLLLAMLLVLLAPG